MSSHLKIILLAVTCFLCGMAVTYFGKVDGYKKRDQRIIEDLMTRRDAFENQSSSNDGLSYLDRRRHPQDGAIRNSKIESLDSFRRVLVEPKWFSSSPPPSPQILPDSDEYEDE